MDEFVDRAKHKPPAPPAQRLRSPFSLTLTYLHQLAPLTPFIPRDFISENARD